MIATKQAATSIYFIYRVSVVHLYRYKTFMFFGLVVFAFRRAFIRITLNAILLVHGFNKIVETSASEELISLEVCQ